MGATRPGIAQVFLPAAVMMWRSSAHAALRQLPTGSHSRSRTPCYFVNRSHLSDTRSLPTRSPPGHESFCLGRLKFGSASVLVSIGRAVMHGFIKRFADGLFYPEEVAILTAAFDDAWAKLQAQASRAPFAEQPHALGAREILAKQIIMAA